MDVITYLKRVRHLARTKIYYYIEKFDSKVLTVKDRQFRVKIANTIKKRRLGLMYRKSISKDEGMLFVYDDDSKHSIWMFNTQLHLDIIWLDSRKRVVDMFENAVPCRSIFDCPLHLPKKKSRYTIELPKGTVRAVGIKIGDIARF